MQKGLQCHFQIVMELEIILLKYQRGGGYQKQKNTLKRFVFT